MKYKKPNIIFIIIDAMARECLNDDNDIDTTPTFNELIKKSIVCSNFYSHGAPTEFSMPSIFTSSYPLDYGGYQFGIKDRPNSIIEVMQQSGYKTALFSNTFVLDKLFYFDRGVDHLKSLYDIESVWRSMKRSYLWHIDREYNGCGTEYITKSAATMERFFTFIIDLAGRQNQDKYKSDIKLRIYDYKFKEISKSLKKELDKMRLDSGEYVTKNINKIMSSTLNGFLEIDSINELIRNALKKIDGAFIPFTKTMLRGYQKNVSAEVTFNECLKWVEGIDDSSFMATVHLLDVHDELYSSAQYFMRPEKIYGNIKNNNKWNNNRQKLSMSYVDNCLRNFMQGLKKTGKYEDTVFVLTSDHGLNKYNDETVLSSSSNAGCFKDIYLSCPLMIFGRDIVPQLIDNIHSSVDIAPTICDLIGVDSPQTYKGISLLKPSDGGNIVISEHTHRGPCDINKPVYMSIRNSRYKYIWKEKISEHDNSNSSQELFFDLEKDKDERINLMKDIEANRSEILDFFREIKNERIKKIRCLVH